MIFIGVDPGVSGGWCAINDKEEIVVRSNFVDHMGFIRWVRQYMKGETVHATLENAHAMPGQGVTGMFNFGGNFKSWETTLMAMHLLRVELGNDFWYPEVVRAQAWQRDILGIEPSPRSKVKKEPLTKQEAAKKKAERRKYIKALAMQYVKSMWPNEVFLKSRDEGLVDALCIAVYCKRNHGKA